MVETGKLIRKVDGQSDTQLIPMTDNSFFYADRDVDVFFESKKTKKADKMILNINGQQFIGERIEGNL